MLSQFLFSVQATAIVVVTALGVGCASTTEAPVAAKPNVLFIAVDDLNDWVGYLGGHPQAHTPNLDAFAGRSVAFTRAYAAAPVCGPSRTALMYGLYPHNSGSYGHREVYNPANLLDIYPTLVELCGLEIDQPLDGTSLGPLLRDPDARWDTPVIMSHGPGNFAVRLDQWRLIRYADGSEELYDLEADPSEHRNLANDPGSAADLARLREHLPTAWVYNVGPRFEQFQGAFRPAESGQ